MNEHFISPNVFNPAATIDSAEIFSVPEHNSSPRTNDLSFARNKILLNSLISIAKEDCPLKILSLFNIRVKSWVYG